MENLFTAIANQQMVDRINSLTADTKPLWGKMTVAQMLAHCQEPLYVALGEKHLKGGLMAFLFGKIAKKQLVKDTPFKRNLPTASGFIVKTEKNFSEEKNKLVELVKRFGKNDPEEIAKRLHPFFGKLNAEEWNTLQYKHLDHHLKQFGV
ncbi:MAG: DUF1569 domain-containing protein [Ginsengibacter sp.]